MGGNLSVLDVCVAAEILDGVRNGSQEMLGMLADEPVLVVDLGTSGLSDPLPPWLPCVVVGIATAADVAAWADEAEPVATGCDVVLARGQSISMPAPFVEVADPTAAADVLASRIAAHPQAAVVLAQVLRSVPRAELAADLWHESLAYSLLQASPELSAWLARRGRQPVRRQSDQPILVDRVGPAYWITLNRPHVRNAIDAAMRDQLCAAVATAGADPSTAEVHLQGNGPDFCSGGDLDEFGTTPDPTTGHMVRTVRSVARAIAHLDKRTTAHIHGWCVGGGIEVVAAADFVEASPDTTIRLPEIEMGLIPGAGGTATISRRIGRHRTAWLALSGEAIDATTALAWRLVDQLTSSAARAPGGNTDVATQSIGCPDVGPQAVVIPAP